MKRTANLSQDVLRKIKQIEIYTRRLLSGSLVGDARSAQKGTGLEFDQIRDYQQGDDVRFIDWNASTRMDRILVKEYFEERSRTVLLAVDISHSNAFAGAAHQSKHDMVAQVASVLALVADYGKDHVGLILFSEEVELYIPPARGNSHVRTIMNTVFAHEPRGKETRLSSAFAFLAQLKKRDALVFLISDLIDESPCKERAMIARLYDLVAVRCSDERERSLPAVGFVMVQDLETGAITELDLRAHNIKRINSFLHRYADERVAELKRYGAQVIEVCTDRPFIPDIVRFFRRRMRY